MKTILKQISYLVTVILVVAGLHANAQEKKTTFGIKGGLNVANVKSADEKKFDNTDSKTGFHAGVTLDYAFTDIFYLMTGLEYTVKGTNIDLGSRELDITAAYIQLPVSVGIKYPIDNRFILLCNFGPYFAYGLHGKSKYGSSTEYDTFGKSMLKNFDCGLLFAAGIEYEKFCFTLGFESGLVNVMQKGNSKAETQNFVLSAGYKF